MKFEDFLHELDGVKGAGNERTAQCPAHEDGRNSLSVGYDNQKILVNCHAGCETKNVVEAMGLTMADLYTNGNKPKKKKPPSIGPIVAKYDYTDEAGAVLFQITRHDPKDFRQRHPNGKGWEWGLGGARRTLYRLPELLASDGPVFIVEGEKDADRLASLGLCATTSSGGAAKWHLTEDAPLANRDVVVIPDNDDAGRKHIDKVANSLADRATSIRILDLPGLLPKGDVSDWLDLGHTIDELLNLASKAPAADVDSAGVPDFDTLAAELGKMENGDAAQLWAIDHIGDVAVLDDADQLKLKLQLKAKKAGAQFLDREWLPAVRRAAKAIASEHDDGEEAPNPYSIHHGQICQVIRIDKEDGSTEYKNVPLCNFDARIVADVMRDDGEDVARHVCISGTLDIGAPLPEISIPAGDLPRMEWPVSNWGARVNIQPGRGKKDTLRHAIQWLSIDEGGLEERTVFTHTGWRTINGQRVFLTAAGGLGVDGVEVDLPSTLQGYNLPNDNAIDEREAMKQSLALLDVAPLRITAPLWASMFLGPLSEIITPAFVLWVEGASGSLKSSLSSLMLNHFGADFNEFNMPAGWESTANALEKLCFHAKDIPLLIDDFRPSINKYENQKMQDAAARVIRAAGNRQGRGRLDSGSEFRRTFAPRGMVLATAEKGALGLSVNARMMTVEVEPGDIDLAKLGASQAQRRTLPYAMAGFVRWLANDYDGNANEIQALAAKIRSDQQGNGHRRLPGAMAALMAAFSHAMKYAIELGAIDKTTASDKYKAAYAAMSEIAEDQAAIVAEHDPAIMFMQGIVNLLASGAGGIEGKGTHDLGSIDRERLGWHDGITVHLLPAAYKAVYQQATSEGWNFPSSAAALGKELFRADFLIDSPHQRDPKDGRMQLQKRDPAGKKSKVWLIPLAKLNEVASDMGIKADDLNHSSPGVSIP